MANDESNDGTFYSGKASDDENQFEVEALRERLRNNAMLVKTQ